MNTVNLFFISIFAIVMVSITAVLSTVESLSNNSVALLVFLLGSSMVAVYMELKEASDNEPLSPVTHW